MSGSVGDLGIVVYVMLGRLLMREFAFYTTQDC